MCINYIFFNVSKYRLIMMYLNCMRYVKKIISIHEFRDISNQSQIS